MTAFVSKPMPSVSVQYHNHKTKVNTTERDNKEERKDSKNDLRTQSFFPHRMTTMKYCSAIMGYVRSSIHMPFRNSKMFEANEHDTVLFSYSVIA